MEERKQESSMFLCPRCFETSNSQTSRPPCPPWSQRRGGEKPGRGWGWGGEKRVFLPRPQFMAATSLCKHSVAHLNPILE